MQTETEIVEKEARFGEKMIEIRVRFWTNQLADGEDKILPKHAWASGVVRMQPNKSHGIAADNPKPFDTLMELPAIIEQVLIENGIKLHPCGAAKKYLD